MDRLYGFQWVSNCLSTRGNGANSSTLIYVNSKHGYCSNPAAPNSCAEFLQMGYYLYKIHNSKCSVGAFSVSTMTTTTMTTLITKNNETINPKISITVTFYWRPSLSFWAVRLILMLRSTSLLSSFHSDFP